MHPGQGAATCATPPPSTNCGRVIGTRAPVPMSYRYAIPSQPSRCTPRSVHDLRRDWDFWEFHQRWLAGLPVADARFGSAAYLPMLDGAAYEVYLAPGGGLVAKPADAQSERLLRAAGW